MKRDARKNKNVFRVEVVIFRLNAKCHNCGIAGHISRKCFKSKRKGVKKQLQKSTHLLVEVTFVNKNEDFDYLYHIYRNANENKTDPS